MAAIAITAANVLASSQATVINSYNFGATITQGQAVYRDANNLWQLANATGVALVAAALGIALNSGSAGQPAQVAIADPNFTPGGTLTAGVPVVAGLAGAINPVTDLTTGWLTCVLGVPTSTTTMRLFPNAGGIAHA